MSRLDSLIVNCFRSSVSSLGKLHPAFSNPVSFDRCPFIIVYLNLRTSKLKLVAQSNFYIKPS